MFAELIRLQILYLDSNMLSNIINLPNFFSGLETLREISLTENEIRYLSPRIFEDQVNLVLLDLRKKFISSWESTMFRPLFSFRVLLLSYNQLSLINKSSVQF